MYGRTVNHPAQSKRSHVLSIVVVLRFLLRRKVGESCERLQSLGCGPLSQELVGVNLMLIQELIQRGIMRKLRSIQGMKEQQVVALMATLRVGLRVGLRVLIIDCKRCL